MNSCTHIECKKIFNCHLIIKQSQNLNRNNNMFTKKASTFQLENNLECSHAISVLSCKIRDVKNSRRKIHSYRRVEIHVSYVTYVTDPTLAVCIRKENLPLLSQV